MRNYLCFSLGLRTSSLSSSAPVQGFPGSQLGPLITEEILLHHPVIARNLLMTFWL